MNWLRAAGWWASDYAYAVDRQVRATLARRAPLLDGDNTPIVILPGIYESWKFLLPLAVEMHGRGSNMRGLSFATFMRPLNAVPAVVAAPPGIASAHDLPLVAGVMTGADWTGLIA